MQASPETDDAVVVCTAMQQHLRELASTHVGLSAACAEYATTLDRAHSEVEAELRSFIEWTAGIEVAGGIFAIVTVGLSEAAAQAAEAARAGEYVAGPLERIARVSRELTAVLARTIVRADVEAVPAIRATQSAEEAATSGLRVAAERRACGPDMIIDSKQAGTKIGRHASDFGRDAKNPLDRQWMRRRIDDIRANPDEVRRGPWHPNGGGGAAYWFYREGADVVVTDNDGIFVTILNDGITNGWFDGAKVVG
ncbi:MAG: hypothetical protein ABI301_04935 [Jatrophihabitantaceae bacterium]